jgi:GNAT superfamily N-acetyltransferase
VHVRGWRAAYAHVFGAERLAAIDLVERTSQWQARFTAPEPHWRMFVAEEDGRIVGFATAGASRDVAGEGELYGIYVDAASWGSGAGPRLMEAVIGSLREDGYSTAMLWVLADNPRARRFYEREGWKADGGEREGEHLGVRTIEVRYRIALG